MTDKRSDDAAAKRKPPRTPKNKAFEPPENKADGSKKKRRSED